MSMLITERAIINPPRTVRVQRAPQVVALPEPKGQPYTPTQVQTPVQTRSIVQSLAALGDRQSWLLLGLILIPVIAAIHNFITYGLIR